MLRAESSSFNLLDPHEITRNPHEMKRSPIKTGNERKEAKKGKENMLIP
jgi:hypothetical protein